MKRRDFALVAAVLLVAGLAAADALRGGPSDRAAPATHARAHHVTTRQQPRAVEGLRPGRLAGRLVYSDPTSGCTIHEIDLATGRTAPLPPLRSTCAIVAAPHGRRVAFTLPSNRRDVMPYRVVDLRRPSIDVAGFRAVNGSVLWSRGGRALAWCEPEGRGVELLFDRGVRRKTLRRCPIALGRGGDAITVRTRRLLLGDTTLLRAPGRPAEASVGLDGSVAVITDDGEAFIYECCGFGPNGRFEITAQAGIPIVLRGRRVLFSPTNCEAAFMLGDRAQPVVSLFAFRTCTATPPPRSFPGSAAAWSPDGRWLAVAGRRGIVIHPVEVSGRPAVRLPVSATDLAWTD